MPRETFRYSVHVVAPRSKWIRFPGFAPSPTGHQLSVSARDEQEAATLGLAESMYPDGTVRSVAKVMLVEFRFRVGRRVESLVRELTLDGIALVESRIEKSDSAGLRYTLWRQEADRRGIARLRDCPRPSYLGHRVIGDA